MSSWQNKLRLRHVLAVLSLGIGVLPAGANAATVTDLSSNSPVTQDLGLFTVYDYDFTVASGTDYFDFSAPPAGDNLSIFTTRNNNNYLTGDISNTTSSGDFALGPGSYVISVIVGVNTLSGGGDPPMTFEWSDPTPLPATLPLFAGGLSFLFGLGLWRKRRRDSRAAPVAA